MFYLYSFFLIGPAVAILTAMVDAGVRASRRPVWVMPPRELALATRAYKAVRTTGASSTESLASAKTHPVNDGTWHMTA